MLPSLRLLRFTSTLRLPWVFDVPLVPTHTPPHPGLCKEMDFAINTGFPIAYIELLRAISESNHEVLKSCLENNLFQGITAGLEDVKQSGHRLTLINPSAPVYVSLHNSALHIGPFIDRAQTKDLLTIKKLTARGEMSRVKDVWLHKRDGQVSLPLSFVLKVDCLIKSKAKLVMEDGDGKAVKGKKDESEEEHILRFEVARLKEGGFFNLYDNFLRYFKYAVDEETESPFKDQEWVVTDIDKHLRGNPLVEDFPKE